MYRIKSPLEEYERVVKENTLACSEDVLPDEPSQQRRVGRRNITLPTLVPSVTPNMAAAEWDPETAEETGAQAEVGAVIAGPIERETCRSTVWLKSYD
jgi:hypothetical protein